MINEPTQPEQPARWTDINGVTHSTPPGTMRSFGMNSPEFYEAVTAPRDPGRRGPGLPTLPPGDRPPVVPGVEWREG